MSNPIFSYQSKLLGERPAGHAKTGSVGGVRGQWEARVRESESATSSSVGSVGKRLSGEVGRRMSGDVSPLIASPSRRSFRSEYLTNKPPRVDGMSSLFSAAFGADLADDHADDLERATNLQATLARLTGTTLSPSDHSDPQEPDTETETESPDLSPPRFLHHLAPDIEYDLDKSRKSRALLDGEGDDPLDLFGKGTGVGGVRKRMSNPLLGEPYYPNPNPVRGWTAEREKERREGRGLAVYDEEREEDDVFGKGTLAPPQGTRRKVSGSAFREVILPLSDPVTTELKRQRPGVGAGVRPGGVEDAVVRLSISGGTKSPSQAKTSTPILSKSTTTSKHSTLGLGRPSALAVPSSNVGKVEPGKRVLSIGKTDGRVLGRHLPRIVSASREPIVVKPRAEVTKSGTGDVVKPRPMAPASRVAEIRNGLMRKSLALEKEHTDSSKQTSGPEKNVTNTAPLLVHPRMPASPVKRLIPDGRGMAGLTGKSVAVPTSPRPDLLRKDSTTSVSGYGSRLRLSRGLPLSSSSVNLAPAPLPSKRLNTNWMDKQRKALVAYEYLCHVGEAQQWIEGCLGEELGWGVVEMEEEMRDGVALAKLVRVYEGEQVVKTIWEDKKHRFRQSDNINYFLTFVRSIGMPETFIFELTDLYDKKNMPKVIYCIHVLRYVFDIFSRPRTMLIRRTSHLLARLGKADKIGNLVGQFDFSDEQLAQAQKGLQGVAMPNFSSVGTALAKECNMEPEEEPETEGEVRDRMLLECEPSIVQMQALIRGFVFRQQISRTQSVLHLAAPSVLRLQSRARGALTRRKLAAELDERQDLDGMAVQIQALARGLLARRRWTSRSQIGQQSSEFAVHLQACARSLLAQRRAQKEQHALAQSTPFIVRLQAQVRGVLQRRARKQQDVRIHDLSVQVAVTALQARCRGGLTRRRLAAKVDSINAMASTGIYTALQDQIRGVLLRKTLRTQVQTLDQSADMVAAIQAQARGVLSRRKQRASAAVMQQVTPAVVSLQTLARAKLARQNQKELHKVLSTVEVSSNVVGMQAFLRAKLAKQGNKQVKKSLDFVMPDILGFQALARGVLARREYHDWLDYLKDDQTQAGITFLQQLLRGQMARRRLWGRLDYIYSNMPSIIKVQAIWRGRQQREKYRKIISGQDIDIAAIQNYMHLLDDSENDFNEQVQIERMRKQVVERIRNNQLLESQVTELDNKIALILQNKLSFEDLVRVKGRINTASEMKEEQQTFNMGRSDPFSRDAHLDKSLWHRRELYQRMFFILQTEPKYLARLLRLQTASEASEQDRRLLQSVVLALFSYGQGRREEYLLLKMLQLSIHEQIRCVPEPEQLITTRLALTDVVLIFIRPNNGAALKAILGKPVENIVNARELDLCIDPVSIYHRVLNDEESESGVVSAKPRDVDAHYAINVDPTSGAAFRQQLIQLQLSTNSVLESLYLNIESVPYALRCMAREMLLALQVATQYTVDDYDLAPVIARCLIMPYILPALTAPESQGVITVNVTALARQNLQEVGRLVEAIATGRYRVPAYDVNMFASVEGYIQDAIPAFTEWILTLASVDDVESHLNTQELVEKSVEPKPITMTRAEVYAMHGTLMKEADAIIVSESDMMRAILQELGGVPNVLYQEGQTAPVTFALSNRFAQVMDDPLAAGKADWVQAKRHILAVLRVQTGTTMIDVLTAPVTEEQEWMWEDVVRQDLHRDQVRNRKSQLPPVPNQGNDYRLEDIRSLPFREVKARAIQYCMKLEKQGLLDRSDDWQALLDDIAADIRSKNKNRQRRKKDYEAMSVAFSNSSDKKGALEEQIASYNKYISSAMDTMQKQGKKRFVWPFSKQHRHLRSMQKAGKAAQFGSFKYSAADLYEKHILLPSSTFSPRQFEKLFVILSSNEVGVFTMEIIDPSSSRASQVLDSCEIRMEDLLQAKFENRSTLDLFDQVAKVRVNTLIFLINRKFYA